MIVLETVHKINTIGQRVRRGEDVKTDYPRQNVFLACFWQKTEKLKSKNETRKR